MKKTSDKTSKSTSPTGKKPSAGAGGAAKTRAAAVRGPDKPNEPRLTIKMTGVSGGGGSKMSFSASALSGSSHFSEDTPERTLYDGPYVPGPIAVSASAHELDSNSDDTFSSGTAMLNIDMGTLQGSATVTIDQVPGDKDDKDVGDEPNDSGDPDESANYIVTFTGEIIPAVELAGDNPINFVDQTITFNVLPPGVLGTVDITLHGRGGDVPLVTGESVVGGNNLVKKFRWESFPPATEIKLQSLRINFIAGNASVGALARAKKKSGAKKDVRAVKGISYGKFQITRYVLPDDEQWSGELEFVALNEEGKPPYRAVHKDWIRRVRKEEGRGLSQGQVYEILDLDKEDRTEDGQKVTQWLHVTAEAGCPRVKLTKDLSLAKQRSDKRFRCRDKITLSTDPGREFAIHDTGNFKTKNRFDRYDGTVGAGVKEESFPDAYVFKLP